jgi:hypothetical protein
MPGRQPRGEPLVDLHGDVPAPAAEASLNGTGERARPRAQLDHHRIAAPRHRRRDHPSERAAARRDRPNGQRTAQELPEKRHVTCPS